MDRDRFTGKKRELSAKGLSALLEITMATELEICISGPSLKEKHCINLVELFGRLKGLVSVKAYGRFQEVFGIYSGAH
jgi:hypothetical protein